MRDKWKTGILMGVFTAALCAGGWAANNTFDQRAKNAVEQAGYTDASISIKIFRAGSGCDMWTERTAYKFNAQGKDGTPVSGHVCMGGLFQKNTRVLPKNPSR